MSVLRSILRSVLGPALSKVPYLASLVESFDLLTLSPILWLKADSISSTDDAEITTWLDSSGNGYVATAEALRKPRWRESVINGLPVIRYGPEAVDSMRVPSFPMPAECTMYFAMSNAGAGGTIINSTNHWHLFFPDATHLTNFPDVSFTTESGFIIFGYHLEGGAEFYSQNGVGKVGGAKSRAAATGNLNIGTNDAYSYACIGDFAEILIFPPLNPTQRGNVEAYLGSKYGITMGPEASDPIRVLIDGDSITAGGHPTDSWPIRMASSLGVSYDVANYAVSSQTISGNMNADVGYQIDPFADGGRNICIMWEYWNEAGISADGTVLYATIRDYYLARKAAGFKVIACTDFHYHATPGTQGYKCRVASDLVRANWTEFADALVELDLASLRADAATFGDDIHLTPAGWQIVADLVEPAVLALS